MENPKHKEPSARQTMIAFMVAMSLAWGSTLTFFMQLDQFRKSQVKSIRADIKAINTELGEAKERQQLIHGDVVDVQEFLGVPK